MLPQKLAMASANRSVRVRSSFGGFLEFADDLNVSLSQLIDGIS
jgi:hypothetical protein